MTFPVSSSVLCDLEADERAVVVSIANEPGLAKRCLALGLRVGAEVEVLRKRDHGIVVLVGGTRIALAEDIGTRIAVDRTD